MHGQNRIKQKLRLACMYPGHAANSPLVNKKAKQVTCPSTFLSITQPSNRSYRRIDCKKKLGGGLGNLSQNIA